LPRDNPFFELPLFRKTRDGRHVVTLNIYPSVGHVSRHDRPGGFIPDSGRLPNRAGPARLEQARVARLRLGR
jgi:hypothetical protein